MTAEFRVLVSRSSLELYAHIGLVPFQLVLDGNRFTLVSLRGVRPPQAGGRGSNPVFGHTHNEIASSPQDGFSQ